MKRLFWLGCWIVATYSLSRTIHAGRTWSDGLTFGYVATTLFWLMSLAGSVGLLTLRCYARERALGNVTRPVALFERLLQRGADGE